VALAMLLGSLLCVSREEGLVAHERCVSREQVSFVSVVP